MAGIFDIDVVVTDGAGGKAVDALLFQKVKFLLPVLVHSQDTDSASRIQPGDLIGSEHTRIQEIRIYLSWYGISFYKRYFESCNEV